MNNYNKFIEFIMSDNRIIFALLNITIGIIFFNPVSLINIFVAGLLFIHYIKENNAIWIKIK